MQNECTQASLLMTGPHLWGPCKRETELVEVRSNVTMPLGSSWRPLRLQNASRWLFLSLWDKPDTPSTSCNLVTYASWLMGCSHHEAFCKDVLAKF